MTLKMTTAQVVETSVTVTNSSFQNYSHPDDHTRQTTDTRGYKAFTIAVLGVQVVGMSRGLGGGGRGGGRGTTNLYASEKKAKRLARIF